MTGEPTTAGTYSLQFRSSGISKLRTANSNYSFADDAVTGEFVYTITPATENITATLSGKNHKTYDGQAVSNDEVISTSGDIKVAFTYPGSTEQSTYTLQNGDYVWYDDQGNQIAAPKDAGTYTIKLTSAGLGHLQSVLDTLAGQGNVTLSESGLGGSAQFTIDQKDLGVALSDKDVNHPAGKTYDGQVQAGMIDPNDGQWTPTGLVTGDSLSTAGLTASDFDWVDENGHKLTSVPTDAGTYYVALNAAGKTQLATDNPNYKITESGQYKYVISQADATITIAGNSENHNAEIDAPYAVTIKLGNNPESTVTGLTKDDFQIVEEDGTPFTPGISGTYKVALTSDGWKKLQDAYPNYKITVSADSTATFKLDATLEIKFVDDDNHGVQIGESVTKYGYTGTSTNLNLTIPSGYELASGQTLPTSYTFTDALNKTITIHLVHTYEPVNPDIPDVPGTPDIPTNPDKPGENDIVEDLIFVDGTGNVIARLPKLIFGKKGSEWTIAQVSALIKKFLPKGWVLPTNFTAKPIQINGRSAFVTLMLPGEDWNNETATTSPREHLGTVVYFMNADQQVVTNATAYWPKKGASAEQVLSFAKSHLPASYELASDWHSQATQDRPTAIVVKVSKKSDKKTKKLVTRTASDRAEKRSTLAPLGLLIAGLGMLGLGTDCRRKRH